MNNIPINSIVTEGKKLAYDWVEYDGLFYRIVGNTIVAITPELIIDESTSSFRYRTNESNIAIVVIKNYIGFVSNTPLADIEIFKDGYFICNSNDPKQKELRLSDVAHIIADDIYRIEDDTFIVVSNGIHYKLDKEFDMTPISSTRVRYNKETEKYEHLVDSYWKEL